MIGIAIVCVALAATLVAVGVELYDGLRQAPRHAELQNLVLRTRQDRRDAEEAASLARLEMEREWEQLYPPATGDHEMWM